MCAYDSIQDEIISERAIKGQTRRLIQVPVPIIEVIKSAHTLLCATKGYSHTAVKSRTIAEPCSAVYIVAASQTSVSQEGRDALPTVAKFQSLSRRAGVTIGV